MGRSAKSAKRIRNKDNYLALQKTQLQLQNQHNTKQQNSNPQQQKQKQQQQQQQRIVGGVSSKKATGNSKNKAKQGLMKALEKQKVKVNVN
eukprot:Pgem_evm1s12913